MNQQLFPWAVAVVLGFLACTTTVNGPTRTSWEYRITWTGHRGTSLGEEAKQVWEEIHNELGEEGWEYCGNVATSDTMDFQDGWAVNLWRRQR